MNRTREGTIIRTGLIGIGANVLLSAAKAVFGAMANSVAMMMDALNNLSDALSSAVTIVGTRLAGKAPDREHPMGHGRIEYLAALIVAVIVTSAGLSALIESVKKIFSPPDTRYTAVSLAVIALSAAVKTALGLYTQRRGRETESDALRASGTDALFDALISLTALAGAAVNLIWDINLEGILGTLISLFILRTGAVMTAGTLDDILGRRIGADRTAGIREEILSFDGVLGVYDLYLDAYGPGKMAGSVHIEVDEEMKASQIDVLCRAVSARILEKYGALITCGIYCVNVRDERAVALQREIREAVMSVPGVVQMHGFRLDEENREVTFDLVRDFSVRDTEGLIRELEEMLKKRHPEYRYRIVPDLELTD